MTGLFGDGVGFSTEEWVGAAVGIGMGTRVGSVV